MNTPIAYASKVPVARVKNNTGEPGANPGEGANSETWRVDKKTAGGLHIARGHELMTQIEAVHAADVWNEIDRGRGVKWVAVETVSGREQNEKAV